MSGKEIHRVIRLTPLSVELLWVVEQLTGKSHNTYVMMIMVYSCVQYVQYVHFHVQGHVITFRSAFLNCEM